MIGRLLKQLNNYWNNWTIIEVIDRLLKYFNNYWFICLSIEWKQFVLNCENDIFLVEQDKGQESKYGIVVSNNNFNCDSACYPNQCYAARGHGNDPKAQYCWGPGTESNPQCQRCKDYPFKFISEICFCLKVTLKGFFYCQIY